MSDERTQDTAQEASADVRTPPYIAFQTLLTFLKAMKTDGLPPQIDKSVLSKLSYGVQGQLKIALRVLGLMDTGDKPTPALEAMVNAFDTPAFEPLLLERLKATYPYVFALDLIQATPTMFAEAFKVTGAKEDVLRKCRTFFLFAAKRAGVPLGPRLSNGSVTRTPSSTGARRRRVPKGNAETSQTQHNDENVGSDVMAQLLAKFPEFDPAWSEDLKAKWFTGFGQFMKSATKS